MELAQLKARIAAVLHAVAVTLQQESASSLAAVA